MFKIFDQIKPRIKDILTNQLIMLLINCAIINRDIDISNNNRQIIFDLFYYNFLVQIINL